MKSICRGDVYYANLGSIVGSEQGGNRPVVIVQNDIGNRYSPTVIVVPLTTQTDKSKLPTHVKVNGTPHSKSSLALCEQIKTIDKKRLGGYVGKINSEQMTRVNKGIGISVGIPY